MFRWLCKIKLHKYPDYIDARSQAPGPVRCIRCGHIWGSDRWPGSTDGR